MKALLLVEKGSLELLEIQKPIPEKGQVLVKLKASALNKRDDWISQGKYPDIKPNTVLGADGAGVIEAVGQDVAPSIIGNEVIINPNINWGDDPKVQSSSYHILGMPMNGTFAEYVVIDSDRIHAKPKHLSWAESAALPLAGLTAFRALFRQGQLKQKENVLISGVGGGVAQFTFQFAYAAGANVYVTSGNQEKLDKCISMGAKGGYSYKEEGWFKKAHQETGGFDVVIDSAGGNQLNDFIKIMKPAGRIVFYGATNGTPQKLDMFRMFWNQITLQGSTMGNDQEFKEMVAFVVQNSIKPIIDSVRPLDEIVSAFNKMHNEAVFGKLVISIS